MRPFLFAGGTAVVTGAASGIGEALAHALAERGSDLLLIDRDESRLDGVAAALGSRVRVTTHVVDLADAAATTRAALDILGAHSRIRLLVNNAGVALAGRFDQVTLDEFAWVIDINFVAAVRLTHLLLPALKAETGAHLVNVSSVFGLAAPPGQTAYAASKFALRGFSDSLRGELAEDGIGVTCVHPGGIRTRIADQARLGSGVDRAEYEAGREQFAKLLTIAPAKAATAILSGVRRRRARVLIGGSARGLDLLARTMPVLHGRLIAAAAARWTPRIRDSRGGATANDSRA